MLKCYITIIYFCVVLFTRLGLIKSCWSTRVAKRPSIFSVVKTLRSGSSFILKEVLNDYELIIKFHWQFSASFVSKIIECVRYVVYVTTNRQWDSSLNWWNPNYDSVCIWNKSYMITFWNKKIVIYPRLVKLSHTPSCNASTICFILHNLYHRKVPSWYAIIYVYPL